MILILARAITWFAQIMVFSLAARAILSWFVRDPYSTLGKIYEILIKVTEPIVSPCRKILSRFNTGMFDFSVLLAFFLVEIVANLLIRILFIFY